MRTPHRLLAASGVDGADGAAQPRGPGPAAGTLTAVRAETSQTQTQTCLPTQRLGKSFPEPDAEALAASVCFSKTQTQAGRYPKACVQRPGTPALGHVGRCTRTTRGLQTPTGRRCCRCRPAGVVALCDCAVSRPRPAVATTAPLSLLSGTQGRRGPGRPGACSSGPTHVAPVTLSFHETAARSPVSASRRRSGLGLPGQARASVTCRRAPAELRSAVQQARVPACTSVLSPQQEGTAWGRRGRRVPTSGTRGSYRPSDPRVSVLQRSKKHKMEENA